MCTHNAGIFLDVQLRSLVEQARMPQHIVVSDDLSTDGTWEKLEAWAAAVEDALDVRVTLIRNAERLGVTKNFEQAIRALGTDIVFLADQDDIWLPTKIARLAQCIEGNSDVLLVHSDAFLVDAEGKKLGKSLFEALRLSRHERDLVAQDNFFEIYCRRNLVTGMATAFHRDLLSLALPFPQEWIHDEWLAICAAAIGRVLMLDDKLTMYRQHESNVIGIPVTAFSRLVLYAKRVATTPRDEHLKHKYRRLSALHSRLHAGVEVTPARLELVEEAERHFARRLQFAHSLPSRMGAVIRESRQRGYHRFADGFAGMVRDLIHL
ncbi:glycosyltransferase family 2 protein [Cupriavidus necator]|uniref:glycosyltransferase family 2 protein n=1 Tax=Cupriavidus necator TaxID=106590 RepID=UPI003F73E4D4